MTLDESLTQVSLLYQLSFKGEKEMSPMVRIEGFEPSQPREPLEPKSNVSTYSTISGYVAGVAGFEPANQGVKVPSLNLLAIPLYGAGDGS